MVRIRYVWDDAGLLSRPKYPDWISIMYDTERRKQNMMDKGSMSMIPGGEGRRRKEGKGKIE